MSAAGGAWSPTGAEWQAIVDRHFSFLFDHGFRLIRTSRDHGPAVTYAIDTLAVEVMLSNEFRRVDVQLIRLVDGDIPSTAIWYEPGTRVARTLLDNVVEARRPELLAETREQQGLEADAAERQLQFWADMLLDVVPDFLRGDDHAFDEASRVVAARVAEHGQEATIALRKEARPMKRARRSSAPPALFRMASR